MKFLDCTLRDGGYYNNWDFDEQLVKDYLFAMAAAKVDFVELGFRSFESQGFRGAFAYTTDAFLESLNVPDELGIGVMMNASEIVKYPAGAIAAVQAMFSPYEESPVGLIRFACHFHEFEGTLPACSWLKEAGYTVGINLMQIADRSDDEIESIAKLASEYPLDVLYFADSMGSLGPDEVNHIVSRLRNFWKGELGIHAHDNMGRAILNNIRAMAEGVSWVDSTVTGMGRGPGNAQTEYMAIEVGKLWGRNVNFTPLLALIREHFDPLQTQYGWGKNPYYYLAGQYGIHPTFIQQMLNDSRYGEAEILSMIEHLQKVGGKKYSPEIMEAGRQSYNASGKGSWKPSELINHRSVLILGAGPGIEKHRTAVERFIVKEKPFVIALNTQSVVAQNLIDARAACHPFRLLADCDRYRGLPQPLITPENNLDDILKKALKSVVLYDFGLSIEPGVFQFESTSVVAPTLLVFAYALGIATTGKADKIFLAGFDGFESDDPRTKEMIQVLATYESLDSAVPLVAITPTCYPIPSVSVYSY